MDYFWSSLGELLRGEKTNADFSIWKVLVWMGLAAGGFWLYDFLEEHHLESYALFVLPAAALFALIKLWRAYRRWRQCQKDRYKSTPLSRDELRKARSKIQGGGSVSRISRPAPRAPDTNLKY